MSVNGVSSNGQVGFQTFDFAGLSPEMMLAYMQQNMQSLDGQIAGILDDMNARRADIAAVNEATRQLRSLKSQAEGDGIALDSPVSAEAGAQIDAIKDEYGQKLGKMLVRLYPDQFRQLNGGQGAPGRQIFDLVAKAETTGDLAPELQAVLDRARESIEPLTVRGSLGAGGIDPQEISAAAGDDGRLSDAEIDDLVENLQLRVSELNDTTEYDSMRVGALMQKRSQLIQLTSNIMRDMNESAKAVIQNI